MAKKRNDDTLHGLMLEEIDRLIRERTVYGPGIVEYELPEIEIFQERPEKKKQPKTMLEKNLKVRKLSIAMIMYVYPRIFQLLSDFCMETLDVRNIVKNENDAGINCFEFHVKKDKFYVSFEYGDEYQITNECPALKNIEELNFSDDCDEWYFTSNVVKYIEYCNSAMNVLSELEKMDAKLNETIQRTELCIFRMEPKVLIEKYTAIKTKNRK